MNRKHDMEREERQWQNMDELLAHIGSDFSVMEEEVDVHIQQEFMRLMGKLTQTPETFKQLCTTYQEHINDLFDDTVSNEEKKKMLVVLCTLDDVATYRAIESYHKADTALQKWATIALQQSRMVIQSALSGESTVFVSTGLGGQGTLLRYFCVYLIQEGTTLQPFQYDIVCKETELAVNHAEGRIEQCENHEKFITILLLLPLKTHLKNLFEAVIDECNTYGHFLQENMIITNVKKLSTTEIEHLLTSKHVSPPTPTSD